MSFFGGNNNVSHWSISVRYKASQDEGYKEGRERRLAEQAMVKAAGFKIETYFQFRNDDAAGKVAAKKQADALAAKIEKATGVKMSVNEGCFL